MRHKETDDASGVSAGVAQFRRLKRRYPGEMDAQQLAEAEREVRDIVLRGTYSPIDRSKQAVRFENVGCKPRSRRIEDFFVEFIPLSGGDRESLPVESFLERYKFFASDCAQF